MSLIWTGILLIVVGKVLKIGILDTLGFVMVIAGLALFALSIVGISLPIMLPF